MAATVVMIPQVGITRIEINNPSLSNTPGAKRLVQSRPFDAEVNDIYRSCFSKLGCDLLPGEQIVQPTVDEFMAGYDRDKGVDVLLRFKNYMAAHLQEKILQKDGYTTVTLEYEQDPATGELGDWAKVVGDFYFVAYVYQNQADRELYGTFRDWILLNWTAMKLATVRGEVPWYDKQNTRDGARASFKAVAFHLIPDHCVLARKYQ